MEIDISLFKEAHPYAFISYAHEDEKSVKIIKDMISGNYNIWFDALIKPISNWSDELALRIQHSEVVVSLITERYLTSDVCRKEIHHAIKKKIPVLAVFLENVTLPPGLELHLDMFQYLKGFDCNSDQELLDQICANDGLQKCIIMGAPLEVYKTCDGGKVIVKEKEAVDFGKRKIELLFAVIVALLPIVCIVVSLLWPGEMRNSRNLFIAKLQQSTVTTDGKEFVPLSDIEPFDGKITWNEGVAKDPHGNLYYDYSNYVIFDNNDNQILPQFVSTEYHLDGEYTVLSGFVVPHASTDLNMVANVLIYADYGDAEPVILYDCGVSIRKVNHNRFAWIYRAWNIFE